MDSVWTGSILFQHLLEVCTNCHISRIKTHRVFLRVNSTLLGGAGGGADLLRDGQAETSKCNRDFWEMSMRSRRSHPPQRSSCSPEAESSIVDMAAGVNKRQPVAFILKSALQ